MPPRIDPALIPPSPDLGLERAFWAAGVPIIAGLDEAGRGALAGPVCVGAVVLPHKQRLEKTLFGVRDSKQMTPLQRESWSERIKEHALAWAVGAASSTEIDELGIVPATRLAACRALDALPFPPDHLLLDYLYLPEIPIPQTSLIKGDARSLSIAAASILSKVARDAHLCELGEQYPRYHFARHKGYGTRAHRAAIAQWGPCPVHRLTFTLIPEPSE